MGCKLRYNCTDGLVAVGRVVDPGRAMQAVVGQTGPAAGLVSAWGGRGVGRHAPNPELIEQALDIRREPGPVTRLAGDLTLCLLSQVLKEPIRYPRLEAQAGWKLDQEWPQLRPQSVHCGQELE